jgi:hypothetical protein
MDWLYFLSAATAGAVSLIELTSRYSVGTKLRDLFGNLIGWLYLATHLCAGLLAMFLCQTLGLVEFRDGPVYVDVNQLKAIGVGIAAITVLRSDILSLRDGERKVSIGLGSAVELLLKVLDRKLDIARGLSSGTNIRRIMKCVGPQKVGSSLVPVALGLRETMSKEEQKALSAEVEVIVNSPLLSNTEKQFLIGVTVCRMTGIEILEFVVNEFGDTLPDDSNDAKVSKITAELDTKLNDALKRFENDDDQTLGDIK